MLRLYRSVSKVNDEWFADEDRVRASVGLLEKPATSKRQSKKEVRLYCDYPFARNWHFSLRLVWIFLQFRNFLIFLCFWQMTCEICFENQPLEKMKAPRCGHYFCETCWTGQVLAHHCIEVFSSRMPKNLITPASFLCGEFVFYTN
jgi:ariadne-1